MRCVAAVSFAAPVPCCILWRPSDTVASRRRRHRLQLVAQANLSGHTSSVTSVEMRQTGSIVTLVSASADNTVRCWRAETGDPRAWECLQTIDMGAHFALSLSLCALPARAGSLLAIGCDDSAVHLFAKPNGSDEVRRRFANISWRLGVAKLTRDPLALFSGRSSALRHGSSGTRTGSVPSPSPCPWATARVGEGVVSPAPARAVGPARSPRPTPPHARHAPCQRRPGLLLPAVAHQVFPVR